jgi:hypothetical protein
MHDVVVHADKAGLFGFVVQHASGGQTTLQDL